jgi:hypothetical protein
VSILEKDMKCSDIEDSETIARLKGKEAKAFIRYVHSELTSQEKQELQNAIEFYMQKCPKITEKE